MTNDEKLKTIQDLLNWYCEGKNRENIVLEQIQNVIDGGLNKSFFDKIEKIKKERGID